MRILSNGSKWAGEAPEPLEALLERLAIFTLEPMSGITQCPNGTYKIHGNFVEVSHVFDIETEDAREAFQLARELHRNPGFMGQSPFWPEYLP